MECLRAVVVLGATVIAQLSAGDAKSQQFASPEFALKANSPSADMSALPPVPGGQSTVLGGQIRNVDPVQDQFQLKAFGEKPMKIMFDARTQVYRDGKRIPLRDLEPEERASVQTVLDGTKVFAISIHILSQAPEGECEGRVLTFNAATRELAIRSNLSPEPIKLVVPDATPIIREGQPSFTSGHSGSTDLVDGALVSISFESSSGGRSVANRVAVLAVPGYDFVFSGNVSSLDMSLGTLVVLDPRDEKSYQIHFDPGRIPASRSLHPGSEVSVTANFDGTQYVANQITIQ